MNCIYCGFDIVEDDIPFGEVYPDGHVEFYHGICLDIAGDEVIERNTSDFTEYRYDYDKYGTPPHPEWIRDVADLLRTELDHPFDCERTNNVEY